MPILPIIYICAIAAAFGVGWFYGWRGEYAEVVALEQQLNTINTQSEKLLAATQAHNLEQTIKQQEQIADIEAKYNEQISNNDSLNAKLVDAQRVRRSTSTASGCRSVSKTGNATRSKIDDKSTDTTAEFSERLDRYLSESCAKVDKVDAEKRLLIDWIKTIPPEMIQ
jgi:uncharacterized membrane-anchored protein